MEIKGAGLLYALAGLMITFAGFSALLLSVRPAAGARSSLLDKYLAKTVMTYIFVLTAGALLPTLLALYELPERTIWRLSVLLFAPPMLALQVTYPHRRRNVIGQTPPFPIYAVFVVLGAAVTLAMLACILADVPYGGAVYVSGLTVDFFTVIYGYMIALDMIMRQPLDAPEGK